MDSNGPIARSVPNPSLMITISSRLSAVRCTSALGPPLAVHQPSCMPHVLPLIEASELRLSLFLDRSHRTPSTASTFLSDSITVNAHNVWLLPVMLSLTHALDRPSTLSQHILLQRCCPDEEPAFLADLQLCDLYRPVIPSTPVAPHVCHRHCWYRL
jgi:hypothetical protein